MPNRNPLRIKSLKRRNSTIEFQNESGINTVVKYYHKTYDIKDEFDKLSELSDILGKFPDFRCVKIFGKTDSSLILEYIDESDLSYLDKSQLELLKAHSDKFIKLFSHCHKNGFSFDSDLSNIFYSESESKYIIIDPTQANLGIEHLSFIVFSLSILKSIGKARFLGDIKNKLNFFRSFIKSYTELNGLTNNDILISYSSYISVVKGWNIEMESGTGFFELLRRKILRLIWTLVLKYITIILRSNER